MSIVLEVLEDFLFLTLEIKIFLLLYFKIQITVQRIKGITMLHGKVQNQTVTNKFRYNYIRRRTASKGKEKKIR